MLDSCVNTLAKPLCGIIPPMVTPLLDSDTLDVAGLERLVEHILAGGVHGLFILGTAGEMPSLSRRLRHELMERVCAQVGGRVPILVGITDTSFVNSVELGRKAAQVGAQAVVLAPPYNFSAGQPELLEYVGHLLPELQLPLFLYNPPNRSKPAFEPQTVRAAAEMPGISGLKDSSANMIFFHHVQLILESYPDFALLIGSEQLLADSVLLGAHGGVCGGANLLPRLYVELYEAARAKDLSKVEPLHRMVMRVCSTIYSVGQYESSSLKGLKCALSCLGICSDFVAEPFHRLREPQRQIVCRYMEELGITKQGLVRT